MAHSQSRNVNGYVNACVAHDKLKAKLEKKLVLLQPLTDKVREARIVAVAKSSKLTGGQMAEAKRILTKLNIPIPALKGGDFPWEHTTSGRPGQER